MNNTFDKHFIKTTLKIKNSNFLNITKYFKKIIEKNDFYFCPTHLPLISKSQENKSHNKINKFNLDNFQNKIVYFEKLKNKNFEFKQKKTNHFSQKYNTKKFIEKIFFTDIMIKNFENYSSKRTYLLWEKSKYFVNNHNQIEKKLKNNNFHTLKKLFLSVTKINSKKRMTDSFFINNTSTDKYSKVFINYFRFLSDKLKINISNVFIKKRKYFYLNKTIISFFIRKKESIKKRNTLLKSKIDFWIQHSNSDLKNISNFLNSIFVNVSSKYIKFQNFKKYFNTILESQKLEITERNISKNTKIIQSPFISHVQNFNSIKKIQKNCYDYNIKSLVNNKPSVNNNITINIDNISNRDDIDNLMFQLSTLDLS